MRIIAGLSLALVLTSSLAACATYHDDLMRAQTAVDEAQPDRALALLRRLEREYPRLDNDDRVRYAYLRGITDYRIGYRAEARHWLGIAQASDKSAPGALTSDWKTKLNEALAEMNEKVFDEGGMHLQNVRETRDDVKLGAKSVDTP